MIFTIKKLLTSGLLILCTFGLVWAVGFGLFLYGLYHQVPPANNLHSDAIVVLTGGDDRVKESLRLLEANVADKLFISGAGQKVTTEDILRASGFANLITNDAFKARITLGHTALNTQGNAEETKQWALANNVYSLRMVTAYYHMPRSQLEFHFVMPEIQILEHPVFPTGVQLGKKESLRMAFYEYHKYVAVLLRQAGIWQSS